MWKAWYFYAIILLHTLYTPSTVERKLGAMARKFRIDERRATGILFQNLLAATAAVSFTIITGLFKAKRIGF